MSRCRITQIVSNANFGEINNLLSHGQRKLLSLDFSIQPVFTATSDEFSVLIEATRVTLFSFPFYIDHNITWEYTIFNVMWLKSLGVCYGF